MKIKKETVVLALVIVALSGYLMMRRSDETHYALPELSPIEKKQISKLEISKAGHSVVLVREQDRWYLEDGHYSVEPAKADAMVDEVAGLVLTALVSESQAYERYGLDPAQALEVKAWAGQRLVRSFAVGNAASTYRHTFVRLADDARVYHVRGNLEARFDTGPSELRDKTVLSFEPGQIHSIQIIENGKTVALERRQAPEAEKNTVKDAKTEASDAAGPAAGSQWVNASGTSIPQAKADQLISDLSRLQCDHYLENQRKEDFKDPVIKMVLEGPQSYTLCIFEKTPEGYSALSSMNPDPFVLTDYRISSMKTHIQELEQPDAPESKASDANAG